MCFLIGVSDSGSVGSDGRAGSRGEKKDPGVPGHDPKDAVPAPHPGPLISGAVSTSSCPPSATSFILLTSSFFSCRASCSIFWCCWWPVQMRASDSWASGWTLLNITGAPCQSWIQTNLKYIQMSSTDAKPGPSIICHDVMQQYCKCNYSHYSAWYWAIIPPCVPLWWKSWIYNTLSDFTPKFFLLLLTFSLSLNILSYPQSQRAQAPSLTGGHPRPTTVQHLKPHSSSGGIKTGHRGMPLMLVHFLPRWCHVLEG